jgi:hypothetical protein
MNGLTEEIWGKCRSGVLGEPIDAPDTRRCGRSQENGGGIDGWIGLRSRSPVLYRRDRGGNTEGIQPLRLGLSTPLVEQFIQQQTSDTLADIFIHADHSVPIGKGLIDGYIDIACIFENTAIESEIEQLVIDRVKDPLVWVRARNFVLSPGTPVPILTWPGDDWMMRTLTRHGIAYNIFHQSRLSCKTDRGRSRHRLHRGAREHGAILTGASQGILSSRPSADRGAAVRPPRA